MKLYNFGWGPYPRRLTIYLSEKGITDLDRVDVEFPHQPELWPPGFLSGLNPNGSLPVLELDDGRKIGQSLAIMEYLEERYPTPTLLGSTAADRAATRELVAVLDEATSFFGIWARQGSRLNVGRHEQSVEAAAVGAERFVAKLRVAESMVAGPFLRGDAVSIADVVSMALLEFVQGFYGVPIPAGCVRLATWYERFAQRPSAPSLVYPPKELKLARGLPEQTQLSF